MIRRALNRWPDTLISTLGLVFYATTLVLVGLMAIVVFSIYLSGCHPAVPGYRTVRPASGVCSTSPRISCCHVTLGLIFLAIYLRIMRPRCWRS